MRPSGLPGALGYLTVAGRVDASAFSEDALWLVAAVPRRRDIPENHLLKIDLHSSRLVDLYPIGGFAAAAMVRTGDSLWVAEGLGGDKLHRIDATSGGMSAAIALPRNRVAVAAGEGGVWVLAAAHVTMLGPVLVSVTGTSLFEIDAAENAIVAAIEVSPSEPPVAGGVVITPGFVWVAQASGGVLRIDPGTKTIVARFASAAEAAAAEPAYRHAVDETRLQKKEASDRLGQPVYGVARGAGTWWAFSRSAEGRTPDVTHITKLRP